MQSVIELLVGIPSVVYGFVGLVVVVPFIRHLFGGTGSGILAAVTVLFVMVLPTITSMSIDSLKNVPKNYREASIALGATLWQTIYKVILRSAIPGILTAVIFGMARAFGEALAVQMVIGNAPLMPENLISPASTLTSTLTVGIGNTVYGDLAKRRTLVFGAGLDADVLGLQPAGKTGQQERSLTQCLMPKKPISWQWASFMS